MPENTVDIANVSPGQCISLSFPVSVTFTNANNAKGEVSVTCSCGVVGAPPDQPASGSSGTLSYTLAHPSDADGHTVTAALKQGGVKVAGDSVSPIGFHSLCPIVIGGGTGKFEGLTTLDPSSPLSGTFDPNVGNRVVILVQKPQKENGALRQPLLVYADPAVVDVQAGQGLWKHVAFPDAANGQHIKVILTKDGKVKSIARAIFKSKQ